jgi:fructose-1,6-bisphosphatase/inositol monophosphatase family enzyme
MNEDVSVEKKQGVKSYASQVVTAVDIKCKIAILARLLPTCDEFNLALLSEETEDDGSIWDFAATACIYQELGLLATNFEGGRLELNRREGTFMNHEGIFYAYLIYR